MHPFLRGISMFIGALRIRRFWTGGRGLGNHPTALRLFLGRWSLGSDVGGPDAALTARRSHPLRIRKQAQAAPTQIDVVLNWFEELKQKVPAGKK
jgi:hypothetical protein